jgi:branched-chain amino acid transport system ATP-binding protein
MLDIRNARAGYGSFEVLHDVSLSVSDRQLVTLLGHNGAGKSTLLKAIAGQIAIASGSVSFNDTEISRRDPGATARAGIRYVPQDGNVFPNISIVDNLKIGAYAINPSPKLLEERKNAVYELFPALKEREGVFARVLSGGQRQMLAIGMALMTAPKVLMLDEPSSGLSPVNVQRVFDAIVRMRDELGTSVLLVEQNVNEALRVAEKAYVMQEGRMVFEADAGEREAIIHHLWGLAKTAEVMEHP